MDEQLPDEPTEQKMSSPRPLRPLSGLRLFSILGVVVVLIILVLVAARYWPEPGESNENTNRAAENSPVESLFKNANAPVKASDDSDGDGLVDEAEATLGTDPKLADTDHDGLFDAEEVNIYKTKPLVADTDGDGYADGAEVKNGFQPNGPGILYDLTNSLSNATNP